MLLVMFDQISFSSRLYWTPGWLDPRGIRRSEAFVKVRKFISSLIFCLVFCQLKQSFLLTDFSFFCFSKFVDFLL